MEYAPVLAAVFLAMILHGMPDALAGDAGSVSLDRQVYPVPFGGHDDGSKLRYHDTLEGAGAGAHVMDGAVTIHIGITDADLGTAGSDGTLVLDPGMLAVEIRRGPYTSTPVSALDLAGTAIGETSPGTFGLDLPIRWDDGPGHGCPREFGPGSGCVLRGDVIAVTYADADGASGGRDAVSDAAIFDMRGADLRTDEVLYVIGSKMILTLTDPDLDLDSRARDSYSLNLLEWNSDAGVLAMGGAEGRAAFGPDPAMLEETGPGTGVFQAAVRVPEHIGGEEVDRGEEIMVEYTDRSPEGASYVGEEEASAAVWVFTSNFRAGIGLDQRAYTWTDKVRITIVAPAQNTDGGRIERIGGGSDPLRVSTWGGGLDGYLLEETGPDTGVFSGEVTLTGFNHDAVGAAVTPAGPSGVGPDGGMLPADRDDRVTVSYWHPGEEEVVNSALVSWGAGWIEWLADSYPAGGTGAIRVTDHDMDLNPLAIDHVEITVSAGSSSDSRTISVPETDYDSGVFEREVLIAKAGSRGDAPLRVADVDTVTATYNDVTLPVPYGTDDAMEVSASASIAGQLPGASIRNLRVVDGSGAGLDVVGAGQRAWITADLEGFRGDVPLEFIAAVRDGGGHHAHRAVAPGHVPKDGAPGPSAGWTPERAGSYVVTAMVAGAVVPDASIGVTVGASAFPPPGRIPVSNPRVTDGLGVWLDAAVAGREARITADLANHGGPDQEFAYVVSVLDAGGAKVHEAWVPGRVDRGGSSSPYVTWTPPGAGAYEASIHVRPGYGSDGQLAPPARIPITVVEEGQVPEAPPREGTISISGARVAGHGGNRLSVGDPVLLTATFSNSGDAPRDLTYVAEIRDRDDVVRRQIRAVLDPGESESPGFSWTPDRTSTYEIVISARPHAGSPVHLAPPAGLVVYVEPRPYSPDRITLGRPAVVDGAPSPGQRVEVANKITSNWHTDQAHAYIVQIKDGAGEVVHIAWALEDLPANGEIRPSITWVPDRPGRHEITAFVWSSLSGSPLAPPSSTTVHVADPR
ncbi:MAG: hypothetical protein MPL62_11510 [Alphaproteobacteria bacterium]|nr:hypothetical protein [Alphaproteobacteria bacterium]